MDGKMLARLGAIVFIAIAVTATAIEMSRDEEPAESWTSSRTVAPLSDPLQGELIRCQALGEAGAHDRACLQAWAESRRRFLRSSTPAAEPRRHIQPTQLPSTPAPSPNAPVEAQ